MKKFIFPLAVAFAATLCFSSCSEDEKDEPTITPKSLSLTAGQTETLTYSGGQCTWTSDEPLIATVGTSTGKVTAERIGTTLIRANEATCEVTVEPQYTAIVEPLMDWNASQNSIISKMSKSYAGYELFEQTSNLLSYYDSNNSQIVFMYLYSFENSKMTASSFAFLGENNTDYMTSFLGERYVAVSVDEENAMVYCLSIDQRTLVAIQYTTMQGEIVGIVMYMPSDDLSKSAPIAKTEMLKHFGIEEDVVISEANKKEVQKYIEIFKEDMKK